MPVRRSRSASQRNDATEAGMTQAASTSVSMKVLTPARTLRSIQASAKPRIVCPMIPETRTKTSVSHSEFQNRGSLRAVEKFSRPMNSGLAAAKPVNR